MARSVNTSEERIDLTAFDKGATAAIKSVSGALGGMRAGLDSVNGALAAVGVTLGAGAMVKFAKDIIAADAALDDMAESTGASVEGLSALRRVAQVGGHDFDGLTAQIGKTIKGLRENSEEGGKAARAFEHVGVKTRDANGNLRDMSEVIVDLARAVAQYGESGDRTLLVQDALGKGAERYIPLLEDVAKGTDLVATTTARQAAEAEEAEKAWKRFMVTLEDNRRVMVREYTPALRELLEQLAEGTRIAGGFFAAIARFGTLSPFDTPGENAATQRQVIEQLIAAREQLAKMPGYGGAIGQIDRELAVARQRLEFSKFLERQQALAGAGDENLDARDLAARGRNARSQLVYRPPSDEELARQRRDAERIRDKLLGAQLFEGPSKLGSAYLKARVDAEKKLQEEIQFLDEKRLEYAQMVAEDEVGAWAAYYATREGQAAKFQEDAAASLARARDAGLLSEREYQDGLVEVELEGYRRRYGIQSSAALERMRLEKMSAAEQADFVLSKIDSMTAGLSTRYRAIFEINKIAAASKIALNLPESVSDAFKWGNAIGGPYFGAAMAALAGTFQAAQIAAIATQQFGGSAAAPSLAGTTAAPPVTPVAAAPARQEQATFVRVVVSNRGEADAINQLLEAINEKRRDGGARFVLQ